MANKYIQMHASNSTVFKKYMATEMKIPHRRMDNIDYTLEGGTDKSSGPVIREWAYVLRVPVDVPYLGDTSYGLYSDLETLFDYTEAHGTPTDVISFKDHFATTTYSVYFMGDMDPSSMTPMLSGGNAWFLIPVTLVEKK